MFTILWTIGFIINGVPQIRAFPDAVDPMELSECEAFIMARKDRLPDLIRGRMGEDLDFPLGLYGECVPVRKGA